MVTTPVFTSTLDYHFIYIKRPVSIILSFCNAFVFIIGIKTSSKIISNGSFMLDYDRLIEFDS